MLRETIRDSGSLCDRRIGRSKRDLAVIISLGTVMKVGLVGYQGSGKSTVFELLTGVSPDPGKVHSGQLGVAVVPDDRLNRLADLYQPKKLTPAKIELLDTPGLSRTRHEANAQRLSVIREANALVLVVGCFAGCDPADDVDSFEQDLILADLQVVTNRIARLRKDVTKPRPDRDELQQELESLEPIEAILSDGRTLRDVSLSEMQEKACKAFSLLTRKQQLLVLNTSDAGRDEPAIERIEAKGYRTLSAPFGLELELQALGEEERQEFAKEMGLVEPSAARLLRGIFELTDQITFYTCDEKEVRAWLLKRGDTALDAAGTIHSDLARGFIRAEIMPVEELLRLESERAVKAAGLNHVEGKDYVIRDGDEIVVRFNV